MSGDGTLFQCKGPLPGGATCDIIKKDVNHWYVVWIVKGEYRSRQFDPALIAQLKEKNVDVKWVCGRACAQKLYERYLETGAL